MAIDTSIYGNIQPVRIDNPLDNYAKVAQIQNAQQQNQLANLTMQDHQRAYDRQNKLLSLMGGLPADATDDQRTQALKGSGFLRRLTSCNQGC